MRCFIAWLRAACSVSNFAGGLVSAALMFSLTFHTPTGSK